MLQALNEKNAHLSKPILHMEDAAFATYGKIVHGYDVSELVRYMQQHSQMPEQGNIYIASVPELENTAVAKQLAESMYGAMPIEIGYCNGRNQTFNGMEYHKGSEITVAVTDFMLILGHIWDIQNNTYKVEDAQVFFVPEGTVFELYQTTLHLSPCAVSDDGFKAVIVLPKGTNTPIEKPEQQHSAEDVLLLQRNKWVLAHPEREPLMKQGAHPGILGENIKLNY